MKTIEQLMADLQRDENTAFQAVLELQTRVNPEVVNEQIFSEFIELLENENPMVRECAAVALGKIGDPRAIRPLIQALGDPYDDSEWRVAVQASNALSKIGAPALEELIQVLQAENAHIRFMAAQTLAVINDPRVVEPLVAALGDESAAVRWQVVTILGSIGDTRALEKLESIAQSDIGVWNNLSVAKEAGKAIKSINKRLSSGRKGPWRARRSNPDE